MGNAKRWMTKIVPKPLLRSLLSQRSKRWARQFAGNGPQQIFTDIYDHNHWGSAESVSGPGSEAAATHNIAAALPALLQRHQLQSILDAPCGDFQWMQHVALGNVQYIGGDIVQPLIDRLVQTYGSPTRRFIHLDITAERPPAVDLIFCRDCFIHLPFNLIRRAMANFAAADAKYVLLTTYRDWPLNYDTAVGGARAIDLLQWPFNLPPPMELIQEDQPSRAGEPCKCMGLWPIAALTKFA